MTRRSMDKDTLNEDLLLSLPMREATGTATTQDVAKPHHPITLVHAPVWTQLASGLWVLDFDGTNDYMYCPAAYTADFDFTAGDYSWAVWVYFDTLTDYRRLLDRGSPNVDGWYVYVIASGGGGWKFNFPPSGSIVFFNSGTLSTGSWQLLSGSRQTLTGYIYHNGIECNLTWTWSGNALTANRNLGIGNTPVLSGSHDGQLWNPRIWGRALTPQEHMSIFQRERQWFGV